MRFCVSCPFNRGPTKIAAPRNGMGCGNATKAKLTSSVNISIAAKQKRDIWNTVIKVNCTHFHGYLANFVATIRDLWVNHRILYLRQWVLSCQIDLVWARLLNMELRNLRWGQVLKAMGAFLPLVMFCQTEQARQAHKPRSYASFKLQPADLMTYWRGWSEVKSY